MSKGTRKTRASRLPQAPPSFYCYAEGRWNTQASRLRLLPLFSLFFNAEETWKMRASGVTSLSFFRFVPKRDGRRKHSRFTCHSCLCAHQKHLSFSYCRCNALQKTNKTKGLTPHQTCDRVAISAVFTSKRRYRKAPN